MAIEEINKGTGPNTGTGTPARTAADMINANFAYLDSKVGTKELLVENNAVTGTYAIDWTKDTYYLTLTGNTTFSQINIPLTGVNTKELKIYLTGNYVPTFPAGWDTNKIGTYKGTEVNEISIKYIKSGVYFVKIENSLTQYPAPILGSMVPVSLLPSSTAELRLKGSFFTPAGFVLINGQTVNSIEFDANTGDYILSVTTGALEGEFDIVISNGTTVTFAGRLIVNLGEVFIPTESDWENISGTIDISEEGNSKIEIMNVVGSARWSKQIKYDKDWIVEFQVNKSTLGLPGSNSQNGLSFRRISDNSEILYNDLFVYNSVSINNYHGSTADGNITTMGFVANNGTAWAAWWNNTPSIKIRIKYLSGIAYLYHGDVLKYTYTQVFTENMKIIVDTKTFDFINIKYIELP